MHNESASTDAGRRNLSALAHAARVSIITNVESVTCIRESALRIERREWWVLRVFFWDKSDEENRDDVPHKIQGVGEPAPGVMEEENVIRCP